jgi:type I restriction enzyme S subunit
MKTISQTGFKQTKNGMIPEEWSVTRLGNILQGPTRNGIYKSRSFHGSGVKIINMGELFDYPRIGQPPMKRLRLDPDEIERFGVHDGDLLFARRSLVAEGAGQCSLIVGEGEPRVFESSIIRARPDPSKADSSYLFYLFRSPYGQHLMDTILRHVAVAGITGSDLVNLDMPLPPLAEQKNVAKILGVMDDKIELNLHTNKTLEAMGEAIFKHWFIEFEFPNEDGRPYKSAGGEMVHSEELDQEIPKGWEVRFFSEVIAVNPDRELLAGKLSKKVGMADLKSWQASIPDWSSEEYKSGPRFRNGDTLFARITPSLEHGKTALVSILSEDEVGFGSTEFIVFAKKDVSSKLYVFHLARSPEIRTIAINAMTGSSGRQRVPNEVFDFLPIALPPASVVDQFERTCSPLFDRITTNSKNAKILSKIRDSLLPKLMSGTVRVPVEVR